MTAASVADQIAWNDLPEAQREAFRQLAVEEARADLESDAYERGQADGHRSGFDDATERVREQAEALGEALDALEKATLADLADAAEDVRAALEKLRDVVAADG
jgi:flagellar biosynthesis/type III secretory pathway protein FliH